MIHARLVNRQGGNSGGVYTSSRENEHAAAYRKEQARLLRYNSRITALANTVNGLILVVVSLFGAYSTDFFLHWYAILLLSVALRIYLFTKYPEDDSDFDPRRWLHLITLSAGMMGVIWGATVLEILSAPDRWSAALIVFLLAGMVAGSAASNGVYLPSAIAFIVPATLPLFVAFLHGAIMGSDRPIDWAMALLTFTFGAVMIGVARNAQKLINETVRLKEDRTKIADQLSESLDETRASRSELARRKTELQIIADYAYAWETWFSADGELLWVNPAVQRITGYSPEECRAMDSYPLDIIHHEDRDRVGRALKIAQTQPSGNSLEFRVVRKDGEVCWCAAVSMPAMDAAGRNCGFRASVNDITFRRELQYKLERLATTDFLTDALNRSKFIELLQTELYRVHRYGRPTSLASFDIDSFKSINDTHGHSVGDECLKRFAETVRGIVRESDSLGRVGGDEFLLLMPETRGEEASKLCERLRKAIAELVFEGREGPFSISTSVGVTEVDPVARDVETTLNRVDDALYQCKREGRNCVSYLEPEGHEAGEVAVAGVDLPASAVRQ